LTGADDTDELTEEEYTQFPLYNHKPY